MRILQKYWTMIFALFDFGNTLLEENSIDLIPKISTEENICWDQPFVPDYLCLFVLEKIIFCMLLHAAQNSYMRLNL